MSFSSIKYLFKEGAKNVWVNRMMSFASIGVLISCLLLTGAALLFSVNLRDIMDDLQGENVISVYLKQEATEVQAVNMESQLRAIPNIDDCEFISKYDALKQYQDMLGSLFDGLDDDFLPYSYKITMNDLSLYEDTISQIQGISLVDTVSDRSDAAEKISSLNRLVSSVGVWIVLILSAISVFIISNTIRMTMYSRRLEISIMKSVGATNWFIRVPFIVEGIIIGLIAAFISTVLLKVVYEGAMKAINQIVTFISIPFENLVLYVLVGFLISGVLFGALGGAISIRKYLKEEGGEIFG